MFPNFESSQYKLLTVPNLFALRSHILLWHVSKVWGDYPTTRFFRYFKGTKHTLSICHRTDAVPPITADTMKMLLQLHETYGPTVVHVQRVAEAAHIGPALNANAIPTHVSVPLAYATGASVVIDLQEVIEHRLRTETNTLYTYPPAWLHGTPTVPLDSQDSFVKRFDQVTCACMHGFQWSEVVAAGGAVSACLLPPNQRRTPDAELAFSNMDVDLFVFSYTALCNSLRFFKDKFKNRAVFGISRTNLVVSIVGIPRTFHVIPTYLATNVTDLLSRFDLDFCQVAFDGCNVCLTAACMRALATRVCEVSPAVLPDRQAKALKKGYGLNVTGFDVIGLRTFWDLPRTYHPLSEHTATQIEYNMALNLNCRIISRSVSEIVRLFNNSDTHFGPPYVPYTNVETQFTATAFLCDDLSRTHFIRSLPPTPPGHVSIGVTLPHVLVFQKQIWTYTPFCSAVTLYDASAKYEASGREALCHFTQNIQQVMDQMYGPDACVYNIQNRSSLIVNPIPTTRVVDVITHTLTTIDDIDNFVDQFTLCTALQCSTIMLGTGWWAPVFVCQEMDIFPKDLAHFNAPAGV